MSYPHSTATANEVLAAAAALAAARIPKTSTFLHHEVEVFMDAVARHAEAVARKQSTGPNIDAVSPV